MAPKPVALGVTIVEIMPDDKVGPDASRSASANGRNATERADQSTSVERVEDSAIEAPSAATVERIRARLMLGGEGEGWRLQTQYWRRDDSIWQFDSERTLAALGPSDEPEAVAQPQLRTPRVRR